MTSKGYLENMSRKLKRYRVESSVTQKELASITGLSFRTIQQFEGGNDISTENLFKILIGLGLADLVDQAVPDLENRPSAYVDRQKNRVKQRARKKKIAESNVFKWGDEA